MFKKALPVFPKGLSNVMNVSAVFKCSLPARQDVAMTGEITLRGKVLPIGGVKEKVLAAHRMGIHTVLLPKDNECDLEEIPGDVRQSLDLRLIGSVDQALDAVLVKAGGAANA